MKNRADIEKRYEQFRCLELPGQPMMAHMGTNYLVNDLHKALVETEAERDRLMEVLVSINSQREIYKDALGKIGDVENGWLTADLMNDVARTVLQGDGDGK